MSRGPTLLRADTRNDIAFIILHPSYSADIFSPLNISFRKKKKKRGEGRKKNEKRRKGGGGQRKREREREITSTCFIPVFSRAVSRLFFHALFPGFNG